MRRTLRVAVLGTAAAALLGSGLISALADSASSTGNYVETSSFTEDGDGHDLKIAILPYNGETGCEDPGLVYTDNVGAAAFSTPIDMDDPNAGTGQLEDDYCLYNAGSSAGEIWVSFANHFDTEVACTNDEESVDPASCGAGEGELSDALTQAAAVKWGGDCYQPGEEIATTIGSFQSFLTPQPTNITLAPGERCRVYWSMAVDADPAIRRAAQSDAMQWDNVFTLQDPATAP
jgi:hypothetical protein